MGDFVKASVGTFSEELQALIDYGHDCCARIDDRIYECCQRIRKAHEQELDNMSGACEFSMALMKKQLSPVTYDVLGNERHKAVCELRKSDFTLYTPDQFVSTLYKMLHRTEGFPNNIYVMQKGVRDRLIYLLGGDAMEVEDAVDAGGCVSAGDGGDVHAAAGRVGDCAGDQLAEEVVPITQELRDYLSDADDNLADDWLFVNVEWSEVNRLCDAIDAVHKGLERENKELRHDVEMWRDRAEDMRMERDDALKEHHAWAPESHYMMLPKDKDGEPVHVGDVMEWPDGNTFEVVGIDNIGTLYYIDAEEDGIDWTNASDKHHHHEPTVEDVLRGVVTLCHNTWKDESAFKFYDVDDVMKSGNIADFAAKLRLAGDAS